MGVEEAGRCGVGDYCIYLYGKSGVALVLVVGGVGGDGRLDGRLEDIERRGMR